MHPYRRNKVAPDIIVNIILCPTHRHRMNSTLADATSKPVGDRKLEYPLEYYQL